jgi:hypothetical protein
MKKIISYLLWMIISTYCYSQTPELQWAALGGNMNSKGISIVADNMGNVYTLGGFSGTVDFDPGVGTYNLTAIGYSDVFISKLDIDGNFIWVKHFGSTDQSTTGTSIIVDPLGNLYATGGFYDTVDFDPGIGMLNLVSKGNTDGFIVKLNSAGNLSWAKSIGDSLYDGISALVLDGLNNIYMTGMFQGTVDFDPNIGVFNLTTVGNKDIFISKLTNAGSFVFAKNISSGSFTLGIRGIDLDPSNNNMYITGYYSDTIDFDPGAGIANLMSAGSLDVFVAKYNLSGNYTWSKSIGGSLGESVTSLKVDAMNNVCVTGYFSGTADFDPGPGTSNIISEGGIDTYVLKLDSMGVFSWAKGMGGNLGDVGRCISIDLAGNIYTIGDFKDTVDFDPGPGITNIIATGPMDIFISKLDPAGNFVFAKSIDGINGQDAFGIFVDDFDKIYATGSFGGTTDFDINAGVFNLSSDSNQACFIMKISQSSAGIDENYTGANATVYPNPTTGKVNIAFSKIYTQVKLDLFNNWGSLVLTQTCLNENGLIDLENFDEGVYFLRISYSDQSQSIFKIVKIQ